MAHGRDRNITLLQTRLPETASAGSEDAEQTQFCLRYCGLRAERCSNSGPLLSIVLPFCEAKLPRARVATKPLLGSGASLGDVTAERFRSGAVPSRDQSW